MIELVEHHLDSQHKGTSSHIKETHKGFCQQTYDNVYLVLDLFTETESESDEH